MQVHLFGSITVDHGPRQWGAQSFGGRKPKQLLEILLVRRGHPVPAHELAALLWEGLPGGGSTATVQHYVSVLRRRLPQSPVTGSLLLSSHSGYELDLSRFCLDLDLFDAAADAADAAPADHNRRLLELALGHVQGEVLADEPTAPWAAEVRRRYRRRHVHLLLRAAAAALTDADAQGARTHALAAAKYEVSTEPAACLLIAAHYLSGEPAAALAAFEGCRRALSEHQGIDPMPHTVQMHRVVVERGAADELVALALQVVLGPSRQLPGPVRARARLSA